MRFDNARLVRLAQSGVVVAKLLIGQTQCLKLGVHAAHRLLARGVAGVATRLGALPRLFHLPDPAAERFHTLLKLRIGKTLVLKLLTKLRGIIGVAVLWGGFRPDGFDTFANPVQRRHDTPLKRLDLAHLSSSLRLFRAGGFYTAGSPVQPATANRGSTDCAPTLPKACQKCASYAKWRPA